MLMPTLSFANVMCADQDSAGRNQYGREDNVGDIGRVVERICQPDGSRLAGICSDVRTGNASRYESKIEQAACVSPSDSQRDRQRKIQDAWNQFDSYLHCDGFNVRRGNILKYAINQGVSGFIYTAVNVWRVDLNRPDASDGKTVLQYVESELERSRGTPQESMYQSYYNELRRGGAR